jgi:hypothetical protein
MVLWQLQEKLQLQLRGRWQVRRRGRGCGVGLRRPRGDGAWRWIMVTWPRTVWWAGGVVRALCHSCPRSSNQRNACSHRRQAPAGRCAAPRSLGFSSSDPRRRPIIGVCYPLGSCSLRNFASDERDILLY